MKTPVSVFSCQGVLYLSVHLRSPPFSLLSMNENLILFSSAYSHCQLLWAHVKEAGQLTYQTVVVILLFSMLKLSMI